jgi:hypothetical protein
MVSSDVTRHREEKRCAFSGFGFYPDSSPISLHHALANSQSNACAAVLVVAMKALEYAEREVSHFDI